MKNLRTYLVCACITLCGLSVSAQKEQNETVPLNEPNPNKPKLFSSLPDRIGISVASFTEVLNSATGTTVNIPVNGPIRFQGEVVSSASKYNNTIRSIVIRSTNYDGARLTFSMITNADGSINYTGRIISMQHGDLYELQNLNGQYSFVKKTFYEVVTE
jgi:hypothetical protein